MMYYNGIAKRLNFCVNRRIISKLLVMNKCMECREFQNLIHDFIFDKIEYTDELEEFIEHARTCKKCREDLELYYLINRGLGDVPAPDNSGEDVGDDQELEDIFSFYDEWFTKQKKQKWATKISIVVCGIIVICIIGFLIGVLIGYI